MQWYQYSQNVTKVVWYETFKYLLDANVYMTITFSSGTKSGSKIKMRWTILYWYGYIIHKGFSNELIRYLLNFAFKWNLTIVVRYNFIYPLRVNEYPVIVHVVYLIFRDLFQNMLHIELVRAATRRMLRFYQTCVSNIMVCGKTRKMSVTSQI